MQYVVLLLSLLFVIALVFLHPIGVGLALISVIPFDGIFAVLYGVAGNWLTIILLMVFAVRLPPPLWARAWLGTPIQIAMAVFVLCLFPSHAWVIATHGMSTFYMYLRRVTLFAVMGVFVWSLREVRYFVLCAKVLVISMTAFTVLGMADFYLGVEILPASRSQFGSEGALAYDPEAREGSAVRYRLEAPALEANRYANFLMLPTFLSLGWFLSRDRRGYRSLALGCGLVMLVALLASVSRSGILGLAVGGLTLLPTVFRVRPKQVVAVALLGILLPVFAWLVLTQVGLDEIVLERFGGEAVKIAMRGRLFINLVAVKLFLANPIFGVGENAFALRALHLVPRDMGGITPHNIYITTLCERGLVGFVPFAIVIWLALRQLLRAHSRIVPELEPWRPYILAAFVGMLVQGLLNPFIWSRPMWLAVSFAAAYQRFEAAAAQKRRAEQLESLAPTFDPLAPPEPRSSGTGFP